MIRFEIEFSPTAEMEIVAAARYIARSAPLNAERWFEGIHAAIMGLEEMPNRYALARESEVFDMPVRQFVYKSHRVIFTVAGRTVRIHRVVHTARLPLDSPDELNE